MARPAGSVSLTSQPSGARSVQASSNCSEPGIDFIAMVRSGPAATRLTRTPRGPSSRARYRQVDSKAALATPIHPYTGHATLASKSRPTTEARSPNSGRQARVTPDSDQDDTWSATAASSHGTSWKPSPSAFCGAKAMACTTPSSPSTCSRTRLARDSRWPVSVTSSSTTGAGLGSRAAIRLVIDSALPKLDRTISAPSSWAILAAAKAIDASVRTPVTSSRFPSSRPTIVPSALSACWLVLSVTHAEAAVDRDHGPGDVAGGVGGQPGDRAGDLVRAGVPAQRHLAEDLLPALLRQRGGHVGVDQSGGDDVGGDVAGAELAGDRAGEADQPGLGRGVVGLAGRAEQPDDRGDEDEPAVPGPQHAAGGPLGDPERAGQVGVQHPGELLLAHPQQQRVVGDSGVGHQHLHRALLRLDLGEGSVDLLQVGDVAPHAEQP